MPRFFTDTVPNGIAVITGEDAQHIGRSLRMKPGERLTLCSEGIDSECEITSITQDSVMCRVLSSAPSPAESSIEVTLFQALPKSDKLELIIQKSVELGVSHIVPVLTERCISRPDERSIVKKLERWQKIALSAAKQSGRGIIPDVMPVIGFEECLRRAAELDRSFFCYENGGESLSVLGLSEAHRIGLIVGPEGGFEEHEARAAEAAKLCMTSLGKRILRCETAPLAALSAIMLLSGDL